MNHCAPATGCCGPVETDAPIAVTINPEARVNVARTSAPLAALSIGSWHAIDFAIVNEGYVTGPLAVEAEPVAGVRLDHLEHDLTGERLQDAAFRIRLDSPDAVDLTMNFRALAALGGLANHSTIHLLIRPGPPNQSDKNHLALMQASS